LGLLPEFFMLLGIDIFLAMSLLSALLDDEMPSSLQYLFQGAALLGLGQMFVSRGFIEVGIFAADPSDVTRFWISIVYLASAVSNVIGLNVYLAAIRRKFTLASTFSGTVTVPTAMTSLIFVASFVDTRGEVSLTPTTGMILAVAALVSGLSILGFLRQAVKRRGGLFGQGPSPPPLPSVKVAAAGAAQQMADMGSKPPSRSAVAALLRLSTRREAEWEEAPSKEEGGR
jgi:hypothetical protein